MSDRGSFTTEYIYCDKCREAAQKVFAGNESVHLATIDRPVICGQVKGLGSNDDWTVIQYEVCEELVKAICHPMRVAVLTESGNSVVLKVLPGEYVQMAIVKEFE